MSVFNFLALMAIIVLTLLFSMALSEINRLKILIAHLEKDNDQIHELADHYRTANNEMILKHQELQS